jgi:hypothetical protein
VQDQPGQPVARISTINGEVSVRRGDSGDWVAAVPNAPLLAGDSVAVVQNGRAELQLDSANFVRIAGDSEVRLADLSAGRSQIQLAKGLITWRVLRDSATQSEISTPSVAVHPLRLSAVRVEVDADGTTRITVRRGEVEAATARGSEKVSEGQTMIVRGSADDAEFQVENAAPRDAWDSWNDQRDTTLSRAQSPRYTSPDIYGTEDLDQYGRWSNDPAYGNVWMPNVPDTWAPYSNGQWVWEDYYGWTWVPYEPWGWAPFHYGSWYFRTGLGWAWYPGPRYGHYWFHPAMVSFFGFGGGGFGVGFGFGNVGWIPLAPFEVYRPWYGPGWWRGGRTGVINNVNVNIYSNLRNARVAGGVNAVSAQDFQRGAFGNRVAVGPAQLQQASLVRGAVPISPTASNLRFSERSTAFTPSSNARGNPAGQRFFSRISPGGSSTMPQRTPFAQQQAATRSAFAGGGALGQGFSAPAGWRPGNMPAAGGDSGWRRFGEPSAAGGSSAQRGAGNWDRFGVPQQASPQRTAPQASGAAPRAFGYSQGGSGGFGESRSLQVAPPIVRERQAAPSYRQAPQSSPGYRGGGGGAAPRSAPSFHGGGGGGNRGGGGGGHGRR